MADSELEVAKIAIRGVVKCFPAASIAFSDFLTDIRSVRKALSSTMVLRVPLSSSLRLRVDEQGEIISSVTKLVYSMGLR